MTQDDPALRIAGLRPSKRPFSNLLAQTQSPLPSQTRIFSRLRWALQNKNRCPLRGSHDNRSRTRPYSPSNPLRMSAEIAKAHPQLPMLIISVQEVSKQLAAKACHAGYRGAVTKNSGNGFIEYFFALCSRRV